MSQIIELLRFPELIFGVAGPIGVDIDEITTSLDNALKTVQYNSFMIKLTDVMRDYPISDLDKPAENDFYNLMNFKMDYANALCKKYRNPFTLAAIAIREIKETRTEIKRPNMEALP